MRERYLCMMELQEQLMELYDLCGIKSEPATVSPMPVPLQWLEKLLQDNQLYDYLENLTSLSGQAVKKIKEIKLDAWNSQESERQLEDMYQKLEDRETLLEQAKERQAQLEKENDKLRRQIQREQEKAIWEIITLRDNLLMKKEWLESSSPENATAAKLINGQLQETAKILENMGVEILQDSGMFDSSCHTAVQSRPAPDPEQVDRIAETFRPGYRFRNETLRPQEVIVYVKA